MSRVIGAVTAVYGGALGLFWAAVLVTGQTGLSATGALAVVAFGAVGALTVVTGIAVFRDRPRRLAYTTAAVLCAKAVLAGVLAGICLNDSGPFSGISRDIGWILMFFVVSPSLTCAVGLVAAIRLSALPGPEALDYDDAGMTGR